MVRSYLPEAKRIVQRIYKSGGHLELDVKKVAEALEEADRLGEKRGFLAGCIWERKVMGHNSGKRVLCLAPQKRGKLK